MNIFFAVGSLLLAAIVIVIVVRQTTNAAFEHAQIHSVLAKNLLNGLQMISLSASFDYKWPAVLESLFSVVHSLHVAKLFASFTTQLF